MKKSLLSAALFTAAIGAAPAALAVTAGESDTFASGVEGWFAGGGPSGQMPAGSPAWIASGGPAGAGDGFLRITSTGSDDAGGRLVAMNAAQWAGNYGAAGISAIAMDLRNLGPSDLTVRLYFEDPIPGPPLNEAVSTLGVTLPSGGNWTHAIFPIGPGNLTVLQGNASTLLANTTVLRIFSGATADFPPERLAGQLGVDNIQAIPEPETLALFVAGLGCVVARVRRAKRPRVASAASPAANSPSIPGSGTGAAIGSA